MNNQTSHLLTPIAKTSIMLLVVTVINCVMLLTRNWIEGNTGYNFLFWNLFLGIVPYIVSLVAYLIQQKVSNVVVWLLSALWLLFYPNAPYMMSDLIHVQAASSTVIYDTLIIFSISTLSLFFGFYSLVLIKIIWTNKYNAKIGNAVLIFGIVISSLGIYLGRILRLNSWDIFTDPVFVITDTIDHLWPINENPVTYYIIGLFTIIQFLIFVLAINLPMSRTKQ